MITYGTAVSKLNQVEVFVDADWAADMDTRRSQTDYIFYQIEAPVSWQSKTQTTDALSDQQRRIGKEALYWERSDFVHFGSGEK